MRRGEPRRYITDPDIVEAALSAFDAAIAGGRSREAAMADALMAAGRKTRDKPMRRISWEELAGEFRLRQPEKTRDTPG